MKQFIASVVLSAALMSGCVSPFGIARLPDKADFFVTTGDISNAKYQPLALLEFRHSDCAPCGWNLQQSYTYIEENLKKKIIRKAKNLGADGLINLRVVVGHTGLVKFIKVQGLAIKR